MKNILSTLFIIITLITHAFGQTREEYAALNSKLIHWIDSGHADSIVTYFDSTMMRVASPGQLSDSWDVMEMKYGEFKNDERPVIEERDSFLTVITPIVFEKNKMAFRVTYHKGFRIAGLYIRNFNSDGYQVPSYVNSLAFVEYKVTFGKTPVILDGMLTMKKTDKKLPVVIILQGSGPQDMDGSFGSNKIYKDIAWGIASHEIAVFRYPKRTSIYNALYLSNTKRSFTLEDEYVEDVLLAIEALCKRSDIDTTQIYILGHSQGGDAAIVAAKRSGRIKGLIMASTSPRKIQELLCEQLDYLNGYEPSFSEKRIQGELVKAKAFNSLREDLSPTTPDDSMPFNTPAGYWIYLNHLDKIGNLKSMPEIRLLFLQGQRDYQVTTIDYNIWKSEFGQTPFAEFNLYPKLNHMYFKGEARSTPMEYEETHNVDESVITDTVKWIKKNQE